ncbi:MAG: SDR family NAD(P)-dependent oxidoreductase [Burkholderiaceae bacterium]|nr:SDR family NAD(P)-dependent oxidoreductase [Burkholderiaceae bacterium]
MSLNPRIQHWKGLNVWIVGASSGIGRALAQDLIVTGARVTVSSRRAEALSDITPAPFLCLPCDISQPESVQAAIDRLQAADALPDVVFWVAGVYHPMPSHALDLNGVRETFEINTLAGYTGLKLMLKAWESAPARSRHWSWISSVAGYRGLPQAAAYGASKAALTYLAEVTHLELKSRGIAVSVVNPGFVATRLTARNDFTMPAIITPEEASRATLDGLARGEFEIHYPKRFTRWLKFLRLVPYSLYFRIMKRTLPKS